MTESLMWIVAGFSLWGTVLVTDRRRAGFLFWIGTNAAWVAYDVWKTAYPQAVLMAAYLGLAVWGWFRWKEKGLAQRREDSENKFGSRFAQDAGALKASSTHNLDGTPKHLDRKELTDE